MNAKWILNWYRSDSLIGSASGLSVLTGIGQLLGIVNFGFIARHFPQSDIGSFVMFLAVIGIVGPLVLMSYDIEIQKISTSELGSYITFLTILSAFSVAIVCIVGHSLSYPWSNWLSLALFGNGIGRILEMALTRSQEFRRLGSKRVVTPLLFIATLVLLSLAKHETPGKTLIVAHSVSVVLVSLLYFILSFRVLPFSRISPTRIALLLKAYSSNPLLLMPSSFFNSATYNLPSLVLGQYFGKAIAAQYGLVLRFCFAPINLIGNAVSTTCISWFGSIRRGEPGDHSRERLLRLQKTMLLIAIIVAIGMLIGFPVFCKYFLHGDWSTAITICYILMPLFFAMLVIAPFTSSLIIFDQKPYLFKQQFIYLLIAMGSFGIGIGVDNFYIAFAMFSILSTLRYLCIRLKVMAILNSALTSCRAESLPTP